MKISWISDEPGEGGGGFLINCGNGKSKNYVFIVSIKEHI